MEESRSKGLPYHQQKVTLFVYELDAGAAMDRRECDETSRVKGTNSGVNTCHRLRLELFKTECKVFAVPKEAWHVQSRIRFYSWFRATLTSCLYMVTKNHMKKHQKEY